MPPEQNDWDIRAIGQVAGKVNLRSVSLLECQASATPASLFDPSDYHTSHRAIPFGPNGAIEKDTEETLDIAAGLEVAVMFDYHARSKHAEDDEFEGDGEPVDSLHVGAVFTLEYEYTERSPSHTSEVEAHAVRAFSTFNATLNAWPYWREFLQSTTSRMGLPPVTVPTLPVPDLAGRSHTPEEADTSDT